MEWVQVQVQVQKGLSEEIIEILGFYYKCIFLGCGKLKNVEEAI